MAVGLNLGRHPLHSTHCVNLLAMCNTTKIITKKLATVNRSRVSIRVTKVFGQGVVVLGVVDPVNFNLSSSLIAMQKSVDVSRIVCKHVKVRKIWGRWTLGGGMVRG